MNGKNEMLKEYLKSLGTVAVAFSGGVDSTFLLKTAHDVLGDRAVAVTVRSCLTPAREMQEASEFCKKEGIRHIIAEADALGIDGFKENPKNRCYICKTELFRKMRAAVSELGIDIIAEGTNADDERDYRPGLAAVREQGIRSPLLDAKLTKSEIRELSRSLHLPTSEKPSCACLASRIPYGEEITAEKLEMADRAENFLRDLDFEQVRVRIHGSMARIEVTAGDILKAAERRAEISEYLKKLGFSYVMLDLDGYRTGSLNEVL